MSDPSSKSWVTNAPRNANSVLFSLVQCVMTKAGPEKSITPEQSFDTVLNQKRMFWKLGWQQTESFTAAEQKLQNTEKFSAKKTGSYCWIEMTEKGAQSFHRKIKWSIVAKTWHKSKLENWPQKQKKRPKMSQVEVWDKMEALFGINKSLLQLCAENMALLQKNKTLLTKRLFCWGRN